MFNRTNFHTVVRFCLCLSLAIASAVANGQSFDNNLSNSQLRSTTTSPRIYGGWTRSQPAVNRPSQSVQRASYVPQFGDGLQNFSNGPAPQAIPEFDNGNALVNSLSDMPVGPPSQQFEAQSNLGSLQAGGYSNDYADPPQRLAPVSTAAYQNGQNPVLPPPQQNFNQQNPNQPLLPPQYPTQQPNGVNTQLRQVQPVTSGLPYVTPAPQRYPTSPYLGPRNVPMYVNAAYQRTTPVNYATQVPGNNGAVLPQNLPPNPQPIYSQNVPGVYPTSYPQQCAPTLPPDGGAYVPPTITPNWNPNMYSANNSGYRPFFSLGQENYNVVLGRGIIGQPTAYVPGQYIRNFLRYIFP